MAKEASISSFTSNGEVFAAILPDGVLKVWNTSDGKLLAEWKQSDEDSGVQFSCIACSFVGKKRKKENVTCLVALGTDGGEVFTINVKAAELKWKSSGHHNGRITALSFTNKGRKLRVISTDGKTCEMNSETGEILEEIKISKKYISSSVYFSDDKILAAASSKIRVLTLEDGNELLKFSSDAGPVQHISMSNDPNIIITSNINEKNLQIWKTISNTESVTSGPVLSMRHPPLTVDCINGCDEDEVIIFSLSESGIVYIWSLKTESEGNINPIKIKVQGKNKKKHESILAVRLYSVDGDDRIAAVVVFGSLNSPKFALVDVNNIGEDIVVETKADIQENDGKDEKDIRGKKRSASDKDSENTHETPNKDNGDPMDEIQVDNEIDEPTMGEKLAKLNIINNKNEENTEKEKTSPAKPPSADSVHVLLKQALHADDRSLLLDCLFRQNEKVITNSVSLLNPSDAFKLLESLISIIQSRGTVVACALPWLRSLLLQHSSSIMSQESSLIALNSLYQRIESRIITFNPAVQFASSLDLLYSKSVDDGVDEDGPPEPIIFEDFSDEDESAEEDNAMETDEEDNEELEAISNVSDLEGSDGMVDY